MQEDESRGEAEADKAAPVAHVGRKRNDTIHMKILVPSGAVGAIIGKGGESIAEVQWVTGARIKLSKPNDFYPGTMERVCLIQGTLEGITRMHNYIMDRMLEKPECAGPSGPPAMFSGGAVASSSGAPRLGGPSVVMPLGVVGDQPGGSGGISVDTSALGAWPVMPGSRLPWGRHQQVKILVPNCTAGLVIGKLGSYVKEIKDRTGAFIQVSQKSKEINLLERCITIAGEPDQCRAAVALVLAKIAEDPQSTSCPTISYSRVQGPVASAYPTGSPFAFTPIPRYPTTAPAPQAPHPHDISQSTAPYGTAPEAYMTPAFQAALLQAAALALSQRSYYQQQHQQHQVQHAGFAAAPHAAAAPSQQTPQMAASSIPRIGGEIGGGVPSGAGGPGEMGLYTTPLAQSIPTPFVTPGAPGLWPAYEGGWTTGPEHALPGLTASPTAAAAAVASATPFEHTYPAHLNLAYYPTNQQLLAHMASRHPSETYPVGTEVFTPTAFGANVPIHFSSPTGLRVTSTVGGGSPLTTFYPSIYTHPAPEPSGSGGTGKVPTSAVPLTELFASLRLSGVTYPEMTNPELGQLFSTLSQHPGLMGPSGSYRMLSSPTTLGPALSTVPFVSGMTTQALSTPVTGQPQLGTAPFDPVVNPPCTAAPGTDPHCSGRPPGAATTVTGGACSSTDTPVPVIARRSDRGCSEAATPRHLIIKPTDDELRSSAATRSHRRKSRSPHHSPPPCRLSPHFDSASTHVTAVPSIPASMASVLLSPPLSSGGPPLVDTDQPLTSESPEPTSHSQSDPVSAEDVSSSHSSCSPDHRPIRIRETSHREASHTKFKPASNEARQKAEQSGSTKPRFNGRIVRTTTNGLAK